MRKTTRRTFLDRVYEAYEDRHRDKATQKKIATLSGKAQPSVSDWGKPDKYPEMGTVVDLAIKLGVTVEWLFSERGPKHVPATDKDAQALWRLWPSLDDLARSKVVAYAETRAESGEGPGSSASAEL